MVTIETLEVQFDVEGEGDEAVFAKLFEQHMRRHLQLERTSLARERRVEAESQIGERPMELPQ